MSLKSQTSNLSKYLYQNRQVIFALFVVSFILFFSYASNKYYSIIELLQKTNDLFSSIKTWYRLLIGICLALASIKGVLRLWQRYFNSYKSDQKDFIWIDGIVLVFFPFFVQILYYILVTHNSIFLKKNSYVFEFTLLFIFATYALTVISNKGNSQEGKKQIPSLFPDDPIVSKDQDLLSREAFIERLRQLVLYPPSINSFVIGLYGKWGSGKTSVISLLKKQLVSDPVLVYEFDPWFFENKSAIIHNFYFGLKRLLEKHYFVPIRISNNLRIYSTILIKGIAELSFRRVFLSKEIRPMILKSAIEQYIGKLDKQVVVIIDDIDRLERSEILTIFRLVRLSARSTNIVFLLLLDPEHVAATLSPDGKDIERYQQFLEKIVQAPIHLPMTDQKSINDLLFYSYEGKRSLLDKLHDSIGIPKSEREEFDKKFTEIYESHLKIFFSTFRRVYLFMNSLSLRLPTIAKDVYLFDFHVLEVLHNFFPNIYMDIERNKHIYSSRVTWAAMTSFLPYDNEKRKQVIKNHVEEILKHWSNNQRSLVLFLVKQLFPSVVQAYDPNPTRGDMIDENIDADDYRLKKRIAHPDNFDRYFMLQYRQNEIKDSEMEEGLSLWNSSAEKEKLITKAMFANAESETYTKDFLRWLKQRINKLPQSIFKPLINVLYAQALRFRDKGTLWETERDEAEALLLLLINKGEEIKNEEIQPLLEKIIDESPSMDMITHLTYFVANSTDSSLSRIQEYSDKNRLRLLASDRLRKYFLEDDHDIFSEYSGRNIYQFLLYQWSLDWKSGNDKNKIDVTNYLIDTMRKNPLYIGMYLAAFIEGLDRLRDGRLAFNYQSFGQAFDVDLFYSFLTTVEETAYSNDKEKDAIDQFIVSYQEKHHNLIDAMPR